MEYVLWGGIAFSVIVWTFILSNRKQLLIKAYRFSLLTYFLNLKQIRKEYQSTLSNKTTVKQTLDKLGRLRLSISNTLRTSSELTKRHKGKPEYQEFLQIFTRIDEQLTKLQTLTSDYQTFIQKHHPEVTIT